MISITFYFKTRRKKPKPDEYSVSKYIPLRNGSWILDWPKHVPQLIPGSNPESVMDAQEKSDGKDPSNPISLRP